MNDNSRGASAPEITYFICYKNYRRYLSRLSPDQVGALHLALYDYAFDGVVSQFDDLAVQLLYEIMTDQISRDADVYQSKVENGRRGGRPRKESADSADVTELKPKITETKPKITEAKPKITEAKPKITEAKPKLTEAKPKLTEPKPKITEAKPNVTERNQEKEKEKEYEEDKEDVKEKEDEKEYTFSSPTKEEKIYSGDKEEEKEKEEEYSFQPTENLTGEQRDRLRLGAPDAPAVTLRMADLSLESTDREDASAGRNRHAAVNRGEPLTISKAQARQLFAMLKEEADRDAKKRPGLSLPPDAREEENALWNRCKRNSDSMNGGDPPVRDSEGVSRMDGYAIPAPDSDESDRLSSLLDTAPPGEPSDTSTAPGEFSGIAKAHGESFGTAKAPGESFGTAKAPGEFSGTAKAPGGGVSADLSERFDALTQVIYGRAYDEVKNEETSPEQMGAYACLGKEMILQSARTVPKGYSAASTIPFTA